MKTKKCPSRRLLLIVPAYNEESSIERTLDGLSNYNVIVIDDGSIDDTAKICACRKTKCISLPFNQGLSGAFQTGMKYAYINGYEYVLQFDADGQHLPEYIEPMLKEMIYGDADIVIGSRFIGNPFKISSFRNFGAYIITLATKLVSGKEILDPTSGMRMYNRKTIELFANNINFSPEPDTIAYLAKNSFVIKEIPVTMHERIAGKSYLTFTNSIKYMIRTIISILLIQFFRPSLSPKGEER